MVDRRVEDAGGEAKTFPVGVFLPDVFGVPGKAEFSVGTARPLVGEGGGVDVAFCCAFSKLESRTFWISERAAGAWSRNNFVSSRILDTDISSVRGVINSSEAVCSKMSPNRVVDGD